MAKLLILHPDFYLTQMKSDTRIVTLVYSSNLPGSSNFLAVFFLALIFSLTTNQIVLICIVFSRDIIVTRSVFQILTILMIVYCKYCCQYKIT